MTYSHHGISYNTPAQAIAASIYDYATANGNNSLMWAESYILDQSADALRQEMEANHWASPEGDESDWRSARNLALRRLQDEQSE